MIPYQPSELMKMRLMHQRRHKVPHHNVMLPLEQQHGVFLIRTKQGGVPIPHRLHGRALKHKVLLMMTSVQSCTAGTRAEPGGPQYTRPTYLAIDGSLEILYRSNVCMQQALRGCIDGAPSCRNLADLATN